MRRAAKTAAQGSHAEAVPAAAPANDDSQLNQAGTEGRAKESLAGLRNTLWKALFLPVALIIHVSGRAGLLVLTLGSIFCYLLDLFQLPEGTIISLCMTLFAFAGVLLFSIYDNLTQSFLNLSVIPVLGIVLLHTFLHLISYFSIVVNDFYVVLHLSHQIIFATLPLAASTLLSLYLCEQAENFELSTCFSLVYAVYAYWLFRPRQVYLPDSANTSLRVGRTTLLIEKTLLPSSLVRVLYILPVGMSCLVSLALYYNQLAWTRTSLVSMAQSFLLPIVLMLMVAKRHSSSIHQATYNYGLSLTALVYVVSLLDHPVFDDIKQFSHLPEPIPSYLLFSLVGFAMLSILFIRRSQGFQQDGDNDLDSLPTSSSSSSFSGRFWIRGGLTFSVSATMSIICLLLDISPSLVPFCLFGSVMLSELYFQSWSRSYQLVLALLASSAMLLVLPEFFKSTLYYIRFNWSWHRDMTMPQFCNVIILMTVFASLVPALLNVPRTKDAVLPLAMQRATSSVAQRWSPEVLMLFSWLFVLLSVATASMELMVLEQSWEGLEVTAGHVYPEYFFVFTAAMLTYMASKLYRVGIIGPATMLIVLTVQGAKLATYLSLSSEEIGALVLVFLANVLPFVRQLTEYMQRDRDLSSSSSSSFETSSSTSPISAYVSLSSTEVVFYILLHTVITFTQGPRVARLLLTFALQKVVYPLQTYLFSLSLWSLFLSTMLLVFYRPARWMRSLFFALGILFLILSMEGFGVLALRREAVFTPADDHSFVFMLLSLAMTVVAWTRTIPLVDALSCCIYSLLFGFVSTKAMLSWALPILPGMKQLTHAVFDFPFLALYLGKASSTFLVLWSSKDKFRHVLFHGLLVLAICWPFLALGYALLSDMPPMLPHGLIWSSIMSTASTCMSFRAQEVLAYLRGQRSTHALETRWGQVSLILVLAILCMLWTLLAIVMEISALDADIFFPLVALLVLCEDASFLPFHQHPIKIWVAICSVWWYLSAGYHLFLRGLRDRAVLEGMSPYSWFGWDEEVSIWLTTSAYLPIVNTLLALIPLPALYIVLSESKGISEEMLFVLAFASLAAVVGGSIDSVRLLGLVGGVMAAYRCFVVSASHKANHGII